MNRAGRVSMITVLLVVISVVQLNADEVQPKAALGISVEASLDTELLMEAADPFRRLSAHIDGGNDAGIVGQIGIADAILTASEAIEKHPEIVKCLAALGKASKAFENPGKGHLANIGKIHFIKAAIHFSRVYDEVVKPDVSLFSEIYWRSLFGDLLLITYGYRECLGGKNPVVVKNLRARLASSRAMVEMVTNLRKPSEQVIARAYVTACKNLEFALVSGERSDIVNAQIALELTHEKFRNSIVAPTSNHKLQPPTVKYVPQAETGAN